MTIGYIDVTIRWSDPASEETWRQSAPATWWWPEGVPLPAVGDRLRINSGGSPLPGPVRITDREWVCGASITDGRATVVLELTAEVER